MSEVSVDGGTGRAQVRVVHSPDPPATAGDLRREHGADVASDLASAEQLVRDRVEAGRRALAPTGTDDDAQLLERAEAIRAAASVTPPITDDDVVELERLAGDLARAARIRTRTEARFTENLQAKLAASSGIALHPGAIKEAAEAVVAAEASLADADLALAAHGPRPLPGGADADAEPDWSRATRPTGGDGEPSGEDPVLAKPLDDFDELALDRRRAVTRGLAVCLVLVGLGVIALGLDQSPVITIALSVLGVVLGIATVARGRKAAHLLADDKAHSAARLADLPNASGVGNLAEPDAPEPEAAADDAHAHADAEAEAAGGESGPEPESAPEPTEPEDAAPDPWLEQRVNLDAARDEAEELVRSTRRRWHQLAGVDADPHDAEAVIRAHDPQLAYDERVALASPTVRTVAAFHRKAQARWRVVWNSLGHDDPPEPEDLEATLDRLLGDHRSNQADLRRLEAAEGRVTAEADVRRPLVLVEPAAWVTPTRLGQLLSSIPPQGEVFVVEREGAPTVTS